MKTSLVLAALVLLSAGSLTAQKNPELAPYMMADRAAEVALARTAAPKRISDSATVLVLTRGGYVEDAHGTNGFTCLVFRSFAGSLTDPGFWNAHIRAPICLNAAATRSVLAQQLKRTEWIMAGVSLSDIGIRTQKASASHDFPTPGAGAMAYMLSPQQVLSEENPHWMPHLMFFFDKSMPAAAWGAGDGPVIDGSPSDTLSRTVTLLIPVRAWSDGTQSPGH